MRGLKALTFDTGGTILDWHSGFKTALKLAGEKYNYTKSWGHLANELRRRSLKSMLNLGEFDPPAYNFDDAHDLVLREIIKEQNLTKFSELDIHDIAYQTPHNFTCWKDFPENLPKFRKNYLVCSFTILSYRIIIDTAKRNNLSWDCIFSCEGIGKYKILPEAYETVAKMLQLDVSECLMVACHNFDLDAAKSVGFKTAFVRRPDEWGEEGPPDPDPNPEHDIVVDNFYDLAKVLGS